MSAACAGADGRDVFLRRSRSLEPTATWLRRLRRCGFTPSRLAVTGDLARVLTTPPDFTLRVEPDARLPGRAPAGRDDGRPGRRRQCVPQE
ncbi:hypothetical protein [Microbispora siamensis]|uniref:hypothetical protein n=1 Tax=Microbispora siamensis TaxID=564413 RepID=UPI00194F7CD8|nr:hypothetical protein [Microbispora siamensis]